MKPARVLAIVLAQTKELSRRRSSIALLLALPLLFYRVGDNPARSIGYAVVGMGWSISVVALFLSLSMGAVATRMAILGFSSIELVLGKVVTTLFFGSLVAAVVSLFLFRDDTVENPRRLVLALGFAVLGGCAAGLSAGVLLPREMESILLLIGLVGLTFVADPEAASSRILPLHAAERFADGAVRQDSPQTNAWVYSSAVALVLLAATVLLTLVHNPRRVRVERQSQTAERSVSGPGVDHQRGGG